MSLRRVHVFESRNTAFKDADVLQENVNFRAVKAKPSGKTVVSSSVNANDSDIISREVSPDELIIPTDSDKVIHIVPDEIGSRFAECRRRLSATLDDLDIQVSTGRVVDFRVKNALAFESNGKTVPLIYPVHLENGFIVWPKDGKKPNYLELSPETENLIVPAGVYVLVKRFSAKEERRRITAAVCEPVRLLGDVYGFENHLNYFHRRRNGISALLAKGLAAYLNSTLVDVYFRQFSGHTQVNATDLRNMKYPGLPTLERLGGRIGDTFPGQDELDALIREELNMSSDDDPVKVKQRIEEAQGILAALGLSKSQQNERSALTLLALLDLQPNTRWSKASAPLRGITPMMDWFAEHYGKRYAPNTRETVRRQTVHQFMEAGIIIENPDDPARPINSPDTVYQIEKSSLELLRTFGTRGWNKNLRTWLASVETLNARYAKQRDMARIPLTLATGEKIDLSPGWSECPHKATCRRVLPKIHPCRQTDLHR